jgi:hypothetical protein
LIRVQLLGTAAELVPLEGLNDRSQALVLSMHRLEGVNLASLCEDKRVQRGYVIGEVHFHEHDRSESSDESPVNRQFAGLLDVARHARAASPDPRSRWLVGLLSGA